MPTEHSGDSRRKAGGADHGPCMDVRVTIESAEGLQDAKGLRAVRPHPYCVCAIAGLEEQTEETRFKTDVVANGLNPSWMHTGDIVGLRLGQSLEFQVWDKSSSSKPDQLLGRGVLDAHCFSKDGFDGDLEIIGVDEASGGAAVMKVGVVVLSGVTPTPATAVDLAGAGRLSIKLIGATNLRNADGFLAGKSDPYCICQLAGRAKHTAETKLQTKIIDDDLNPIWNHVGEISGFSSEDTIEFQVWDHDTGPKPDQLLGKVSMAVNSIELGTHELELGGDKRATGTLKIEILAFGNRPDAAHSHDLNQRYEPIKITLKSAADLYNADGFLAGKSDPYCICQVAERAKHSAETKFQTKIIDDNLNPVWNHTGEVTISTRKDSIEFQVWDHDTGPKPDQLLGKAIFPVEGMAPGLHELKLTGDKHTTGTLKIEVHTVPKFDVAAQQPPPKSHQKPHHDDGQVSPRPSFRHNIRNDILQSFRRPCPGQRLTGIDSRVDLLLNRVRPPASPVFKPPARADLHNGTAVLEQAEDHEPEVCWEDLMKTALSQQKEKPAPRPRRPLVVEDPGDDAEYLRKKVEEMRRRLFLLDKQVTGLTREVRESRSAIWGQQRDQNCNELRLADTLAQRRDELRPEVCSEDEKLEEEERRLAQELSEARARVVRWGGVAKRQDSVMQQEREARDDLGALLKKHPAGDVFTLPVGEGDSDEEFPPSRGRSPSNRAAPKRRAHVSVTLSDAEDSEDEEGRRGAARSRRSSEDEREFVPPNAQQRRKASSDRDEDDESVSDGSSVTSPSGLSASGRTMNPSGGESPACSPSGARGLDAGLARANGFQAAEHSAKPSRSGRSSSDESDGSENRQRSKRKPDVAVPPLPELAKQLLEKRANDGELEAQEVSSEEEAFEDTSRSV